MSSLTSLRESTLMLRISKKRESVSLCTKNISFGEVIMEMSLSSTVRSVKTTILPVDIYDFWYFVNHCK